VFSYVCWYMQTQIVKRVIGHCMNVVNNIKCLMAGIKGKLVMKLMDI